MLIKLYKKFKVSELDVDGPQSQDQPTLCAAKVPEASKGDLRHFFRKRSEPLASVCINMGLQRDIVPHDSST